MELSVVMQGGYLVLFWVRAAPMLCRPLVSNLQVAALAAGPCLWIVPGPSVA